MKVSPNTIRLLGAAKLLVFATSAISEQLLKSAVGSGTMSGSLVSISKNLTQVKVSSFLALVNSLAILALGTLFYQTLNEQNKMLALLALSCFIAETITLAVSKIGAFGLLS